MNTQENILEKISDLRSRNKFSSSAWEDRGLNPSDSQMCLDLENKFNLCLDNLASEIQNNNNPKRLKSILKSALSNFDSSIYDTEEREFICDYFFEISKIISVDFKDNLNTWLYGKILNTLFKVTSFLKGKEKIIETLSQNCTKCDAKLETYILQKQEGIPDHSWRIIQCNSCNEYNLLSTGPNIKQLKFGNYKEIEHLNKSEFDEEQAQIRLNQIKFFRK
ncbi:hypothetical protein [Flavobacterium sp.]|uniref:hypothetical protein n=1 Tax=Flavobacterium sp. TaxID=239 RepID=UPI0039E5CFAE